MSMNLTTQEVITSVLSLPADERLAVMDAIHSSLADPQIDHGPTEDHVEVQTAWKEEIACRIEGIKSGRVETIAAKEAERMIRADVKPAV